MIDNAFFLPPSEVEGKLLPRELPVCGEIEFVGKGNPDPAKFIVIPKELGISNEMGGFVERFLFTQFGLKRPKVLLSVTGGAQDFKMLSSKINQVFDRGILRAAESTTAWIITGGLDTGVMQFVGDAVKEQDAEDVPCIGIATYKMVSHYETLVPSEEKVYYSQQKPNDAKSAALNPNHTHFILVDSVANWGEEIPVRTALEDYISRVWEIPLVLIVVNGGPGTISTVAEGVAKNFPVIIVEGSGRAADAIADIVKIANKDTKRTDALWSELTKRMPPLEVKAFRETIERGKRNITLFNPNEDATTDMDLAILRAILNGSRKSDTFRNKLFLGVEWGRPDVIRELLERDDESDSSDTKREALNHALQMALELDRPEILNLLVEKGADKAQVDLKRLYRLESVKYLMDRFLPYSGTLHDEEGELVTVADFATQALEGHHKEYEIHGKEVPVVISKQLETAKKVLKKVHNMYYQLLTDGRTTFTDMLVWAIMVNRHDLAKDIWKKSVLPVHSALAASHLYRTLGQWFEGDDDYPECAEWFENQAIKVLDKMDYEVAKKVLEWEWTELEKKNALQIAEIAHCKNFMSHQYVQRFLDAVLYSDDNGKLLVGTSTFTILLLILFPIWGPYKHRTGKRNKFYHLYDLPIVKFWSSTLAYIAFLLLLAYVVVRAGAPYEAEVDSSTFDFSPVEYVMWIWIGGTLYEEFMQFLEDKESYFVRLSNQMDTVMIFLLVAHIVVRIISNVTESIPVLNASIDILIIGTVGSYLRLLNVFAFSKSLGPLFFVIVRLIKDVAKWLFIFSVFLVSFQLGVMALTKQAGSDEWLPYPNGTFAVAFFTILGDFSYAMTTMSETTIGVGLLAVYALVAQIMLVNLLIAMMGDTYSEVKENSDKEWKFFRYALVCDYCTCSPYPPPFNIIFGPILYIFDKLCGIAQRPIPPGGHYQLTSASEVMQKETGGGGDPASDENTIKKMKIAKERILEKDEEEDLNSMQSLSSGIREHLRLMTNQRDSDRIFLEENLKTMADTMIQMQAKIAELTALTKKAVEHSQPPATTTTTTTTAPH